MVKNIGKEILKGAIVGGIIVYIWGFISWMVLPWHQMTFNRFQNEEFVAMAIKENAMDKGIYVIPSMCEGQGSTKEDKRYLKQRMREGPVVFASVMPEGATFKSSRMFFAALFIQCIGAGLISWILLHLKQNHTYIMRVCFVATFGLIAGVLVNLPYWNWWGFSASFTFVSMLDLVIAWFLAGLGMAKVVGHHHHSKK